MKQRGPDVRTLVLIIKKIFDGTFLSIPYQGGISSFSLFLMVCALLKKVDADSSLSLSENLSSFFHFYGGVFNPDTWYLKGTELISLEEGDGAQERPLLDPFIVLDPLVETNNISSSTYRFRDIQAALKQAFRIINQSCEEFQRESSLDKSYAKVVLDRLLTEIKKKYGSG